MGHPGLFFDLFCSRLFATMITTTQSDYQGTFPYQVRLASLPGLSQTDGRESWVGITVVPWLYKMGRLPSYAGNPLDAMLRDAPWSSYQSWLGLKHWRRNRKKSRLREQKRWRLRRDSNRGPKQQSWKSWMYRKKVREGRESPRGCLGFVCALW